MKVILLSLKQVYWDWIISDKKRFEYRRVFRAGPCRAFVYVTLPVARIMGVLTLEAPLIADPAWIAEMAEREHPGEGVRICEYFDGKKYGYAMPIRKHRLIRPGVSLEMLRERWPKFHPPQLYFDLNKNHPGMLKFLEQKLRR